MAYFDCMSFLSFVMTQRGEVGALKRVYLRWQGMSNKKDETAANCNFQ